MRASIVIFVQGDTFDVLAKREINLEADSMVLGDMDLSIAIQTLYEQAISEARQKVREADQEASDE